jgi:hypothetical protein
LECEYISQRDKRWIANARQPDKRLRKPRSEREKELRAEIKAARQRVSRLRQNEVDIMMGRIPRRLREPSGAPEIP